MGQTPSANGCLPHVPCHHKPQSRDNRALPPRPADPLPVALRVAAAPGEAGPTAGPATARKKSCSLRRPPPRGRTPARSRALRVPAGLTQAQIAERDHLDSSREVAPLLQAQDAVELITDGMAIEAVIEALVEMFRDRVPEEAWPNPV